MLLILQEGAPSPYLTYVLIRSTPHPFSSHLPKHLQQYRVFPISFVLIHPETSKPMESTPHPLCTFPLPKAYGFIKSTLIVSALIHVQAYIVIQSAPYPEVLQFPPIAAFKGRENCLPWFGTS